MRLEINGEVVGISGLTAHGQMHVIALFNRRDPAAFPYDPGRDYTVEDWVGPEISVILTGLDAATQEHVYWTDDIPLEVGDEVTLTVLPPGKFDPPIRRCPVAR